MKQSLVVVGTLVSVLTMTSGCSGSDADDGPPPPAGGINGPAVIDPDVRIGPAEDSG